jgi:hypothetical protein
MNVSPDVVTIPGTRSGAYYMDISGDIEAVALSSLSGMPSNRCLALDRLCNIIYNSSSRPLRMGYLQSLRSNVSRCQTRHYYELYSTFSHGCMPPILVHKALSQYSSLPTPHSLAFTALFIPPNRFRSSAIAHIFCNITGVPQLPR